MKTTRKNFLKGLLGITAAGSVVGLAKGKSEKHQTESTITFSRDPQRNEFTVAVDSEGFTNITTKLKGAKTKEFKKKIGEQDTADTQAQNVCDKRMNQRKILQSRMKTRGEMGWKQI